MGEHAAAPGAADRHGEVADARLGTRTRRRHAEVRDANDGQPRRWATPEHGTFCRVPVAPPDHHHVIVEMLGGCHDQVLGDHQAGDGTAAGAYLDYRRRRLLGRVRKLGRESRENVLHD